MKNLNETFVYWMSKELVICFKELAKEYYIDGKKRFKTIKKRINRIRKNN